MKKNEVELIIVGIKMGNEEILHMKIYKDGTLCRSGSGGMPTSSITGMTVEGSQQYWEKSISLIDERVIENPVSYKDEKITSPLEYYLAFFGASSNGETGESAKWTKTSGARFLLDSNTSFKHPLLGFIDDFAIKTAELTNEWFFDVIMTAVYGLQPINLEKTFVTVPKTEEEKQQALSNYVNQILASRTIGWDLVKIGNDRKYKTKEGVELTSKVTTNGNQVSINFYEVFGLDDVEAADKRMMEALNQRSKNNRDVATQSKPSSDTSSGGKVSKKWWEFWK